MYRLIALLITLSVSPVFAGDWYCDGVCEVRRAQWVTVTPPQSSDRIDELKELCTSTDGTLSADCDDKHCKCDWHESIPVGSGPEVNEKRARFELLVHCSPSGKSASSLWPGESETKTLTKVSCRERINQ